MIQLLLKKIPSQKKIENIGLSVQNTLRNEKANALAGKYNIKR